MSIFSPILNVFMLMDNKVFAIVIVLLLLRNQRAIQNVGQLLSSKLIPTLRYPSTCMHASLVLFIFTAKQLSVKKKMELAIAWNRVDVARNEIMADIDLTDTSVGNSEGHRQSTTDLVRKQHLKGVNYLAEGILSPCNLTRAFV